jgi:energy-coupling factor transporter ATP-binding protein EcfA2
MEDSLLFEKLKISGWRQFREIEINFHDRLTILTGTNGAGKSTVLKILKCHLPYEKDESFLATPIKKEGKTSFSLGKWASEKLDKIRSKELTENTADIGSITYSDQRTSYLTIPEQGSIQYALKRSIAVQVNGININSHRTLPRYEELKSISISGIKPLDAYKDFFEIQRSYAEQSTYIKDGAARKINPVSALKQAIISFATFGVGNQHVSPIPELIGLYEKFQEILKTVQPKEVGFERLEIRTPEVIIISSSGEFPIDGASGGLMSIIQLSWQIFLQSLIYGDSRFMVLIDEPENHLHPSMQRSFLSNIVKAFPKGRFVVATHSPFIISSVKDSYVYALRHHTSDGTTMVPLKARSVDSEMLDQIQKAGPANDILREVLGVPVTMPEWSVEKLEEISNTFSKIEISAHSVKNLREQLKEAGLSEFFSYAMERAVK